MRDLIKIVEAAHTPKTPQVPPVDFPALVQRGKKVVEDDLKRQGIEDRFSVKIKPANSHPNTKWVGMYRGMSQFRKAGAEFWLNETLPAIIAEDYHPDLDRDFDIEVLHAIIETLHHEYGHVIEEYVRGHPNHVPELTKLVKAFPDMEDFAETFGRTLSGSDPQWDKIKPVIVQWIRVLTEEDDYSA